VVDLPRGWHPDLAAGDRVGLRLVDGELVLVADLDAAVDGDAAAGSDDGRAAVAAALVAVGAAHGRVLQLAADEADGPPPAETGAWVVESAVAVLQALADAPEALRALRVPLTEVVAGAGLHAESGVLAGPGVAEHQLRMYLVGYHLLGGPGMDPARAEVVEAVGMAWLLLLGGGTDEIPDRAQWAAVASVLDDPVAVEGVVDHLRTLDAETVAPITTRLREVVADHPGAPGPAWALAQAEVMGGRGAEALEVLAAGLALASPDRWPEAIVTLGHLRAVAGDVDAAVSVFRRLGDSDAVTFLERWRWTPPPGVGRNDRCPCGSGRKFKQCCLAHPPTIPVAERAELLWWKAQMWCLKDRVATMPWIIDTAPDEGDQVMFVAVDCHLVDDAALAAFGAELGSLLPDDEAALIEEWQLRSRVLWEVQGADPDGGVALRDVATGDVTVVRDDPATRAPAGALLLAVVVPTGGPHEQIVGQAVRVPDAARQACLALLVEHPSGQDVLAWILAVGDPEVAAAEG